MLWAIEMAIIRVNVPLDFANAKKTVPKAVALHLEDFLKSIYMDVSKNNGTPKPSIINHPFWGTIIFGNIHIENHLKHLQILETTKLRSDAAFGLVP